MKPAFAEKHNFSWTDLGDITLGRPNLGSDVPVTLYRLMQYTLREAINQRFDEETASTLFREAGWIAGAEFCKNLLDTKREFGAFVDQLQQILKDLRVGILRVERADLVNSVFTLTVSEDLDCSGLPVYGESVCDYDEGFIAGILHTYTGQDFQAVEVDCWATGDRTCRFEVRLEEAA